VAACLCGPLVYGYEDTVCDSDVLSVIRNFQPKLMGYSKALGKNSLLIFAVDQKVFERDIKEGLLGEFVAERIVTPYFPLINESYLRSQEVKVKKRIVWELLENVVIEFPELSNEFLIKPEYFMYEIMMRWTRVFPPIVYSFLNMMRKDLRKRSKELMIKGFLEGLHELADEDWITFSNHHVKINRSFIDETKSKGVRFSKFFKSIRRAFFSYALRVLPKTSSTLLRDREIFMKTHRKVESEELLFELEDPKEHLLIPTELKTVAFSDKTSMKDFVRKVIPGTESSKVGIEEMGGVLNSVYLLKILIGQKERRVVVKKFKDWLSLKWFPLALWTLGTKSFAVLGRSRLEREYAMNQFLRSRGFNVPTILYVSAQEKLVFEEFVEGTIMTDIIKRVVSGEKEEAAAEIDFIKELGKEIGQIHLQGVALGDCKPENIIITKKGNLCFLDLEQATRDGNQPWDIAEFLYYAGHHIPIVASASSMELIAASFIRGYLEIGGDKENIRKAGSVQYSKVFSIFTPPHIVFSISNICRNVEKKTGLLN
jgi:tRNA A-37 threonylcarbamoyl transferase component Bud32